MKTSIKFFVTAFFAVAMVCLVGCGNSELQKTFERSKTNEAKAQNASLNTSANLQTQDLLKLQAGDFIQSTNTSGDFASYLLKNGSVLSFYKTSQKTLSGLDWTILRSCSQKSYVFF